MPDGWRYLMREGEAPAEPRSPTAVRVSHATVVATGGLAALIGKGSRYIKHVDDLLTLDGLRLIWERNTEAKSGREGAAPKDSSPTTPGRKPRSR